MKHFFLLGTAACLGLVSCSAPSGGGSSSLKKYTAFDLPATKPSKPSAVRVKVSIKNQAA